MHISFFLTLFVFLQIEITREARTIIPNSEFLIQQAPSSLSADETQKTGPHFCDPVILYPNITILLNEGVLGRIQHALGLVESDVLDTEVTEQVEQELSVVTERYRAVVRITLLN